MTSPRCLLVLVLQLALLTPALVSRADDQPALYGQDTPSAEIETDDSIVLTAPPKGREVQVRATWPVGEGKCPVIIFSHGAFGSNDAYRPLREHWASKGYVVLQPTHADSLQFVPRREWRSLSLDKVGVHWRSRADDVKAIMDQLGAIEQQVPALKGRLDRERIGVGGHSFGSQTTGVTAGVTAKRPGGGRMSLGDPRPVAFVMISPQGLGGGLDEQSWSAIDRPTLMITGTNDKSPRTHKGVEWRSEPFEHIAPGDKYLAIIDDAHHGFGGISGVRRPGAGAANPRHVELVQAISLAFFDHYLRDAGKDSPDPAATQFLSDQGLGQLSDELEWKAK